MKNFNIKGFTLIELMITVAIVGILGAIAYPSYTQYVLRSNRAEAKSALQHFAAKEERFFGRQSPPTYTTTIADLGAIDTPHYTISIAAGASGIGSSYVITATATGNQLNDTDCKIFTISSTGAKSAKKADTTVNTKCW